MNDLLSKIPEAIGTSLCLIFMHNVMDSYLDKNLDTNQESLVCCIFHEILAC